MANAEKKVQPKKYFPASEKSGSGAESPAATSASISPAVGVKRAGIDTAGKTMADFEYFTNRKLVDKKTKEESGKARVAVEKGSTTAKIEYTCPACANAGYLEQAFEKIPLYFNCEKCEYKVKIDKLKKGKK